MVYLPLIGIKVPPSGGSLEIGNRVVWNDALALIKAFPLRGDP